MATLQQVPTQNSLQYTLDSAYTAGGGTLTLSSTLTNIVQAPGVCVVDRVDSSGNKTPTKRDYFTFTGVSGTDLTGCTGGLAGSTNQDHAVGAIVEFGPDIIWAQAMYDVLTTEHSTAGAHILPNNSSSYKQKDSGGTARNVAKIDSSNVLTIGNTTSTTKIAAGGTTTAGHTVPNVADDTVALIAASQTLTNKTLTSPTINVGSDAQGDIYYRSAAGAFTRLGPGTSGYFLKTQGAGANPAWAAVTASPSVADTDVAGGSATSSSTYANITGADVSITITVTSHILLMATVQAYGNVDLAPYTIIWHDGSSTIGGSSRVYLRSSNPRTTVAVNHIVTNATAGTYTYTLQHKSEDNSSSLTAETISLNCISIPTGA